MGSPVPPRKKPNNRSQFSEGLHQNRTGLKTRVIAVIIVRSGQVVQSIKFKHTNIIHSDAIHAVDAFNRWSVDEIILLDVSPVRPGRQHFLRILERLSEACFLPLAVGGWLESKEYAQELLSSGADKLVVNTVLADNPQLVRDLSKKYGRQCIVASIDFRRGAAESSVYVDRGRRNINIDPKDWAARAQQLGVGEILLNCIDNDGAREGYVLSEVRNVCDRVQIPVIAFGGVFRWKHMLDGLAAGADAVAAANIFHYTEHSTIYAKRYLADQGIPIRKQGR
ncbi:MAG: imidazole glycerol phosphate synthase subunit HisF [Candidatus Latescibacteria bacterium]|jgi:cyclase|nr:imidazole glycerol phosphate synthase subunit HisF [Gemmatimonadales bacterium]MBT5876045.1 imidazole glycerol phosphate synthase subunit HisF [Candidatus Latescibacterota bacterium]